MNNDNLYKGDIFCETLEAHIAKTSIATQWQTLCETKLGFPHAETSEEPILRKEPFWRLFGVVVQARMDFLAVFDEAVKIDQANQEFLSDLQRHSTRRGKPICSVPEDILLLLILRRGGAFLTQRYVREVLHLDPRIAEAIIDCLGLPEVK